MTIKQHKGIVLLLGLLLMLPQTTLAADAVAELVSLTGKVDILRDGKVPSVEAKVGSQLFVGDFIRTKSKANAEVLFKDGNRIKIAERSRVDISSYSAEQDQRTLGLARGKMEAVVIPGADNGSERPKRFEIETPNAVAGVRGTTLVVAFQDSITAIHVREAHSGRSVYSISRHHPNQIVNVPIGGMMWVRHQGAPTLMPPSSELGFAILAESLGNLSGLADLQILVDSLSAGLNLPPIFSETFPEALGVEVGVVDMVTSSTVTAGEYGFDVAASASFYALSADSVPFYWESNDVRIDWGSFSSIPSTNFDPTLIPANISGNGPAGTANATVIIDTWNASTGDWTANINGFGDVPNGTSFGFDGTIAGTGADAIAPMLPSTVSATGSGSGIAFDNTIIIGQ